MSLAAFDYACMKETELARLAGSGDTMAFRTVMQRCNQRLFRIARAVVAEEAEAEDVLQEAYLRAFAAMRSFRGESSLLTWLTAITLNEARSRLRRSRVAADHYEADSRSGQMVSLAAQPGPEAEAAQAQARRLIERAVDALPAAFRLVFVLRDVEGCSVAETAAQLGVKPATVKTRLHRARALLRRALDATLADALTDLFPFRGARCAQITAAVTGRLAPDRTSPPASSP